MAILDTFTQANGTLSSTNWEQAFWSQEMPVVTSNQLTGAVLAHDEAVLWKNAVFNADQEVFIDIVTPPANGVANVFLRADNTALKSYYVEFNALASKVQIYYIHGAGGSNWDLLRSLTSQPVAAGDTWRVTLIGQEFNVYRKVSGGEYVLVLTYVDNTNAITTAGKIGVGTYSQSGINVRIDNFGGGSLSAPSTDVSVASIKAIAVSELIAPIVSINNIANVTSVSASAGSIAKAPTISASVAVTSVKASTNASSSAPTISASAIITAVKSTASAALPSSVISSTSNISVQAVVATSSSVASVPVVTSIKNPTITSLKATATSLSPSPVVQGLTAGMTQSVVATALSSANTPVVSGVDGRVSVTTNAVTATSTSLSRAPVVTSIKAPTISAVASVAYAIMPYTNKSSGKSAFHKRYRVLAS